MIGLEVKALLGIDPPVVVPVWILSLNSLRFQIACMQPDFWFNRGTEKCDCSGHFHSLKSTSTISTHFSFRVRHDVNLGSTKCPLTPGSKVTV
jgi:hypothetical protein